MESFYSSVADLDFALKRSKIICPGGSVFPGKAGLILLAWVLSLRPVKAESLEMTFTRAWPLVFVKGVAGLTLRFEYSSLDLQLILRGFWTFDNLIVVMTRMKAGILLRLPI